MFKFIKTALKYPCFSYSNRLSSFTTKQPNSSLVFLGLALIANGLVHSFFFIIMPPFGRKIGLLDTQTGLVLGVSALCMMLAAPVWGALCERWGRRPIIIVSLLSAMIWLIFTALIIKWRLDQWLGVNTFFIFLIAIRVLNSICIAGFKPSVQAFVADSTPPEQRIKGMGAMGAMFGVGTILGGLLAAVVGEEHILIGFSILALLLLFVFSAVFLCLPESKVTLKTTSKAEPYSLLGAVPYRVIWPLLSITLLGLMAYGIIQQVTALRLQDDFILSIDQSIRMTGLTMMLTMLAMIITQGVIIHFMSWSAQRLLIVGSSLASSALVLASFAPSVFILIAATVLLGVGLGLLFPGNLAAMSLLTNDQNQARTAGINGVCQGLGLAIGPILAASLHQISPQVPYLLAAFVCSMILLLAAYVVKHSTH